MSHGNTETKILNNYENASKFKYLISRLNTYNTATLLIGIIIIQELYDVLYTRETDLNTWCVVVIFSDVLYTRHHITEYY